MKKIYFLLVLLLAGCSYDTSAITIPPANIDFVFDENLLLLKPSSKGFYPLEEENYMLFTAYTTEEQAAYLRMSMYHLTAAMNGVLFDQLDVSIGQRYEREDAVFYKVTIAVKVNEQQRVQLGKEVTALQVAIQDRVLFTKEFSRMTIASNEQSKLDAEFHRQDDVVYGYFINNRTSEPIQITRLFMEGINGVVVDVPDFPQTIAAKETLKVLQRDEDYVRAHIQGPLGIYVVLEDGTEQLIGIHQHTVKRLTESMIDELYHRLP